MEMSFALQVFGHTAKNWTHYSFDQMAALDEKSEGQSQQDLSSGDHESLCKISWQSIKKLLTSFSHYFYMRCELGSITFLSQDGLNRT